MMTKTLFLGLGMAMALPSVSQAQLLHGAYTTEWQWDMNARTNWVNLLCLGMHLPLWHGATLEAATLHFAKTNEHIVPDWQTFSNVEDGDEAAAIAKCGCLQQWRHIDLFVGVRNVNEDFFTSPVTAFFKTSSCGIFPTISASYPVANYPLSGLCLHVDLHAGGWQLKSSLYNGAGYNGWHRHDNPFRVDMKHDGVFNMTELNYQDGHGRYFAGVALHNRLLPVDAGGEQAPMSEALKQVSCAWYLYAEHCLWHRGDRRLDLMAQYSENSDRRNACYRYAGLGAVMDAARCGSFGLSGQYARFVYGREWSGELTYSRDLTDSITVQPTLQYIRNGNGRYFVLSARLCYSFVLFP